MTVLCVLFICYSFVIKFSN